MATLTNKYFSNYLQTLSYFLVDSNETLGGKYEENRTHLFLPEGQTLILTPLVRESDMDYVISTTLFFPLSL